MRVALDDSPLTNGHAQRGIGTYTRLLQVALQTQSAIELIPWRDRAQAEILHYPYFDFFWPSLPRQDRAKSVVTIHDVIPLIFPEHYPVGWRGKFNFWRQRRRLSTLPAVITDSLRSQADIVAHLGVKEERISVVPLAIDPALRLPSPEKRRSIKRQLKLPQSYSLYVGDINFNKNLPQLIKMLKYLPWNIKLVCVGANFRPQPIPEWKAIETQLALSDVARRVIFLPEIKAGDFDSLATIYAEARCYLQPSLYEGFGLPVLEAMRCQTPVVATQVASLPEVGGEHALYVQPSAESLAQGVKEVLAWSGRRRAEWLRQAYLWSEQFSLAQFARRTLQVYQSVLEQKSA